MLNSKRSSALVEIVKEIFFNIHIDVEDLKTNLLGFILAKEKLVKKEPEISTKILDTDVFSVNNEFNSKRKQFKINALQKKETVITNLLGMSYTLIER